MSKGGRSLLVLAQHLSLIILALILSLIILHHSGSQSSQKHNEFSKKPELKKCFVSVYPVYVCVYYDLALAELTNWFQFGSCLLCIL